LDVRSRRGNSAHVLALGESDVTRFSPAFTPRVLDGPEVGVVLSSISDEEDTMVEILVFTGASVVVEDTFIVELEEDTVGLDGNRHGTDVEGGGESFLVLLGNILEGGELGNGGNIGFTARPILSGVIVVLQSIGTISDGVLEGTIHDTTVATLAVLLMGAVNKLLGGQIDEFTGRDKVATFHGSNGGESPARSALSLVLDSGDSSLLAPVDIGGNFDVAQVSHLETMSLTSSGSGEDRSMFLAGQISKLVDTKGERVLISGVVFVDHLDVGLENGEADAKVRTGVDSVVLLHPIRKKKGDLLFRGRAGHIRRRRGYAGKEGGDDGGDKLHLEGVLTWV